MNELAKFIFLSSIFFTGINVYSQLDYLELGGDHFSLSCQGLTQLNWFAISNF